MSGGMESPVKSAYGLHRAGRLAEAEKLYSDIIRSDPSNGEALYLLGFLHFQKGAFSDAERLIGTSLQINPNVPDALYNRALALTKLKRNAEALPLFDRLLAMNSGIAEAWHYRGMALSALGQDKEALASYDNALSIRVIPETLNNRANILFGMKRFGEAAKDYAAILESGREIPYARGSMVFARLHACDWRGLEEQRALVSAGLREGKRVVQPGAMVIISGSPEDQRRAAEIWAMNEIPRCEPLWRGEAYRHDRIRVAYLSADFHTHATAALMAGVFENHDRNRLEIHAASFGPDDSSPMRARLRAAFEHFHDLRGMTDDDAAKLLRRLEIDIVIDLKGYTEDSRPGILAHRPAPIQAQYLGFPGTMGASHIQYILADDMVIPATDRSYYSEEVVALPGTYQCNDSLRAISAVHLTRAQCGLPDKGFVFCSFNACYKISPEIFSIWMRLLRVVEGSVLWLLDPGSEAARNLKGEAEERGVAGARLIFAPRMPMADHLARHHLADLFLDTLPCGAHTTASDALWAGLPVLTQHGSSFAGRVASSLNHAMGLDELIAYSPQEYEALALKIANDPEYLRILKEKLARNRDTSGLFDAARFARNLEAAFMTMREKVRA